MKIQHWAIIFIIIILPFSVIARNTIQKKSTLLREETRYNNIIDNATYDAVNQLREVANLDRIGKNIPITKGVADAVVDRFFNTLAVNFNLPVIKNKDDASVSSAKSYFSQYIPAIVIVGYDGLYVYSYEQNENGYEYVLKPKIPYAYQYEVSTENVVTVNFTLDNFVRIYFPAKFGTQDLIISKDIPDDDGYINGYHYLEGYIGEFPDFDYDGINDWANFKKKENKTEEYTYTWYDYSGNEIKETFTYEGVIETILPDSDNTYKDDDDPFAIQQLGNTYSTVVPNAQQKEEYILKYLPTQTDNLSYILAELYLNGEGKFGALMGATLKSFGYNPDDPNKKWNRDNLQNIDLTIAKQDYEYDDEGNVLVEASEFNKLRRETIINLLQDVLKQEFNEHNSFSDYIGVTYEFSIPDIGRDQWNNTVDDISVLSFIQGMPMGYNTYYNNYSLGGARIVRAQHFYAETVQDPDRDGNNVHRVYHKEYCPLIPRDENGNIIFAEEEIRNNPTSTGGKFETTMNNGKTIEGHENRRTRGIEGEYLTEEDCQEIIDYEFRKKPRYYACSECM